MDRAYPSSDSVGLGWSLTVPKKFTAIPEVSAAGVQSTSEQVQCSLLLFVDPPSQECIIRALTHGAVRISFLPFGIPTIIKVVCVCRCSLRGCVHPCVYTSGSQSKIIPLCLNVLRQDLLLNKKLTSSARLADQIALGINLTSG